LRKYIENGRKVFGIFLETPFIPLGGNGVKIRANYAPKDIHSIN